MGMTDVLLDPNRPLTDGERIAQLEAIVNALMTKTAQTDAALKTVVENVPPKDPKAQIGIHLGEAVRPQFPKFKV
jgi:class 3 adenylate cyclase